MTGESSVFFLIISNFIIKLRKNYEDKSYSCLSQTMLTKEFGLCDEGNEWLSVWHEEERTDLPLKQFCITCVMQKPQSSYVAFIMFQKIKRVLKITTIVSNKLHSALFHIPPTLFLKWGNRNIWFVIVNDGDNILYDCLMFVSFCSIRLYRLGSISCTSKILCGWLW